MSVFSRTPTAPTDQVPTAPQLVTFESTTTASPKRRRVPRTRMSSAWLGICVAAVAFVALIVFMLQNTRSVEVTFLWLHGSAPLALALLISAVAASILAMAVGIVRMTQLRRIARRQPTEGAHHD